MNTSKSWCILQVVHENTSTLDTTIPFLHRFKTENNNCRVNIIYTRLFKEQVTRETKFYSQFLKKENINQYDFSCFLKGYLKLFRPIFKFFFKKSVYDFVPKKDINIFKMGMFQYFFPSLRIQIEKLICSKGVDWASLLQFFEPNIVLWDLRGRLRFSGANYFYKYFIEQNIPVILLPHSPHHISPTRDFFDEKGHFIFKDLNNDVNSIQHLVGWVAFKHSKPEIIKTRANVVYKLMGYPGFDSHWVNYLKKKNKINSRKQTIKNILIPLRFFSPQGISKNPDEPFLYTFEESLYFLNIIENFVADQEEDFNLILKPHPKTNSFYVQQLIKELKYKNWNYSYDSFYNLLPKTDVFVSSFTTSIFLPIAFKIPILIVESNTQAYVENWKVLHSLYNNLMIKCPIKDFEKSFKMILENEKEMIEKNFITLREYWDDNAYESIARHLEYLI